MAIGTVKIATFAKPETVSGHCRYTTYQPISERYIDKKNGQIREKF
jgi:hypothetical protein